MFKDYNGNEYECRAYGNILVVQVTRPDGSFTKKNVKVVDDSEFTYKIMRTQIKAAGGAAGLKSWLDKADFSALVSKVYTAVFEYVKEAKI